MKLKMKGIPYLFWGCFVLSSSVYAGALDYKKTPVLATKANYLEVIGGLGIANLDADNAELGVTSSETDKLVQTNSNEWDTFAAQLGLGYVYYFAGAQQNSDRIQWFPSIEPELNLYYLSSNDGIEGDVWRFNSSAFNQLTYNAPLHSTRLMLDAALTIAAKKQLSVYAIGGIGNAWNRIEYSDEDSGNSCPGQELSLDSNTSSKFAWEVGAGVTYAFNDRVGLSLEYLYADLGSVETAASGSTGTITTPIIVPANFDLQSQTGLLSLHITL